MTTTLDALSLGAGVQSTTLALMSVEGKLPKPDVAIFADTQWEPKAVYLHLGKLAAVLTDAGIPVYQVTKGNLRSDALDPKHGFASIPYYTQAPPGPCKICDASGKVEDPDPIDVDEHGDAPKVKCPKCGGTGWDNGKGMGRRQCTHEYKLALVRRKTRELLGAPAPNYRTVPRGNVANTWIGFSAEEVGRISDNYRVNYITKSYPLLDRGMTRADCQRWLESRGWDSVEKSACIGCPLHGNRQWRDMRDYRPDEWADACAFDEAIRHGGANPLPPGVTAYLHSSRVPLRLAPIDRTTRAERRGDQLDILAELGDPDGCSPYGCRSGMAVPA